MVNLLNNSTKNKKEQLKIAKNIFSIKKEKVAPVEEEKIIPKIPEKTESVNKDADISDKNFLGVSLRKMTIGLWFIENRTNFLMLFYVILIIISVITWSRFFYTFGEYIFKGMKEDSALVDGIINSNLVNHNYIQEKSAKNLVYRIEQIIKTSNNNYDIAVEIKNSNEKYWAEFDYYFVIGNEKFGQTKGFILPGEDKYLVALEQKIDGYAPETRIVVENIQWLRIDNHKYPDWNKFSNEHLNIAISNINFTPARVSALTEKLNLNDLSFNIANNTAYNYRNVDFSIVLYSQNKIVGINKHSVASFMSGESRDINITLLGSFGAVDRVLIVPNINILKDDIYIRFKGE